jgi:hypothetical protein
MSLGVGHILDLAGVSALLQLGPRGVEGEEFSGSVAEPAIVPRPLTAGSRTWGPKTGLSSSFSLSAERA